MIDGEAEPPPWPLVGAAAGARCRPGQVPADRILRLLFEEHAEKIGSVRELLESLDAIDDGARRMVFEDVDGEWRHAA